MSDIEALVDSILKMSPPVALVVGLNAIMYYLRRTPKIPKWIVPWLIMLLSAIIYPLVTHRKDMIFSVPYPVVAQIVIGLIIGFAAIGTHRLFQQTIWRLGYDKNENGEQVFESTDTEIRRRSRKRDDPPGDVGL